MYLSGNNVENGKNFAAHIPGVMFKITGANWLKCNTVIEIVPEISYQSCVYWVCGMCFRHAIETSCMKYGLFLFSVVFFFGVQWEQLVIILKCYRWRSLSRIIYAGYFN